MQDPLLQPLQLRNITLRNRVMSTSHAPSYAEQGHPRDRYRLYHEEKAKGGIALTMVGGSSNVSPDSPSVFGQLYAGDDSIIPWFQKLTEGVKQHGAAIMCQLTHMGRRTSWDSGNWLPVIGASCVREQAHRACPKVMEASDMRRVVTDFARAAYRCKISGFDGIEILAHSHLLGQFMSPLINRRSDDYGGSLENRLRLSVQVLEAIREAIGPDMILGMRITGDEELQGGLTSGDCVAIAQHLEATGMVDFFNVMAGAPYDDLGLAAWMPPMGMAAGSRLPVAKNIREAVGLPIFHAQGIADLATARHALTEHCVDMVGMTRAHIADPHIVNKLNAGEENRIRPCVGLGYCVDRVNEGKDALCGHNAATGREMHLPHCIVPGQKTTTEKKQKVVIVGGGPAGLEAARVCAEKGYCVVLFEASSRLGGQLCFASKGLLRRQIGGVADWLIEEVERLNVDIRLNCFAEANDVMGEKPDVVLVATGGWSGVPDIEGAHLTLSSLDILSGGESVTGDVLVWDEVGRHTAAVVADVLAQQTEVNVHFITPDSKPLTEMGVTNHAVAMQSLYSAGVKFTPDQKLVSVQKADNRLQAAFRNILTREISQISCDAIVVEQGIAPADDLYFELVTASRNLGEIDHEKLLKAEYCFPDNKPDAEFILARIGDAIASRNLHAAIYDALRICHVL